MNAHRWMMGLQRPIFDSVESLYQQEGGASSVETDFGVDWALTESGAVAQHRFRVSHIEDTGCVYAISLTFVPIVILLAKGVSRDEAEYALQGWENRARPTIGWAVQQLAQWDPVAGTTAPFFEESVSPLHVSNDGRIERRTSGQDVGVYALTIDGHVVWRTRNREIADAFIAGWDARNDA
jgi:hypothetical protein